MQQTSSSWSKVCFFHQGDDYFQKIEEMIDQAQSEILIETYIFELDAMTENLLNHLASFKRRGGKVQLLVDGFGSYFWIETLQKFCSQHELDFRIYQPMPRSVRWFRRRWMGFFFRAFFILRRLNRRNHRKTVIIDGKTVFLGSFNWTMVHCKKWMAEKGWRDSGVLLEGPGVNFIRVAFQRSWVKSRSSKFRGVKLWPSLLPALGPWISKNLPVRINTRRRDRLRLSRDLIRRFKNAEKRIWVASAYFLPKMSYLRALRNASLRGVDVQILWPGPTDVPMVKWAAQEIIINLLKNQVQVHEYEPTILHAKYLIVDDWATLGSANFNHRSYFHDLEIEAEFDQPEHVLELMNQWKEDLDHSRLLRLSDLQNRPFWQKLLSLIAYRLRYLL